MGRRLLVLLLCCTILLSGAPAWAGSTLEDRREAWPAWTLPGPLPRPASRDDLIYPDWFEGLWRVNSIDAEEPDAAPLTHQARFQRDQRGRLVGDRAFNATAIGRALLGDQLLRVENDPDSANRQMAQLKGDLRLETSVIGRRQHTADDGTFLADELVLQILHAPGPPRLSRIETLSRYERCGEAICAEQWQARYPAPGQVLRSGRSRTTATACASHLFQRRLHQFEPADPATGPTPADGVVTQTRHAAPGQRHARRRRKAEEDNWAATDRSARASSCPPARDCFQGIRPVRAMRADRPVPPD